MVIPGAQRAGCRVRSRAALPAGAFLLVGAVACVDPGTPFVPPDAPGDGEPVAPPPPEAPGFDPLPNPFAVDTDQDGLCDGTELGFGLDPEGEDSDRDGTWDLVELAYGYAPLSPQSPRSQELVVFVDGGPTERVVPLRVPAELEGESVRARFVAGEAVLSPGLDAAAFFAGVEATGVSPADAAIRIEEDAFVGVFGAVELEWRVTFQRPAAGDAPDAPAPPDDCIAGYPFVVAVEPVDGEGPLLALERALVVTIPEGLSFGDDRWCGTDVDPCL